MEEIRGTVKRITFHNPQNGYSVLRISMENNWRQFNTVVGFLLNAKDGMKIVAKGEWLIDPKYGYQFKAEYITTELPTTKTGIEKYLCGGTIKGIGPKYAKVIVDAFGERSFDVIENEPYKLKDLPGFGEKRINAILTSWKRNEGMRGIMSFLQSYGVTPAMVRKIYQKYGEHSVDIVKQNPYRLANDIWGVGFKKADEIAWRMGFEKDDKRRIKAGIKYTLNEFIKEGSTYAGLDEFIDKSLSILGPYETIIKKTTREMCHNKEISYEPANQCIYLPFMKKAEDHIAQMISEKKEVKLRSVSIPVEKIEKAFGIQYEELQKEAIITAASEGMCAITGGPGTGKTTIMNAIVKGFKDNGLKPVLAAPTGKAAKRLSESTGMPAKTIHRLLEFNPSDGSFNKNETSPLSGDILIIDESSMLDLQLFYSLLKAVPLTMRLVLVGDVDQLPSVGAGNVLHDIISSRCCEIVRLNVPFRQAAESDIIKNAHKVNNGHTPELDKVNDFIYFEAGNAADAKEKIIRLVKHWIPNQYGFKPDEIQVLAPTKKSDAGTYVLNDALQEAINPDGVQVRIGNNIFRIGDQVMQLRNNYSKNVFNGDSGTIVGIDDIDETITVNIDGREITYENEETDELTLSYAITIHKSQGSEYPVVIIPILSSHYIMLQRNLLYTGITRGKKLVVLVGDKKSIQMAAHVKKTSRRNSGLDDKLREAA